MAMLAINFERSTVWTWHLFRVSMNTGRPHDLHALIGRTVYLRSFGPNGELLSTKGTRGGQEEERALSRGLC
jgi:hypothetical protein